MGLAAASDIHFRLRVVADNGLGEHPATRATKAAFIHRFYGTTLSANFVTFGNACVHCRPSTARERVPRLVEPTVHATQPNDLLQFGYIKMPSSWIGEKHIVMLRVEYSGHCWFFAFRDTIVASVARANIDCCTALGVPRGPVSDEPTQY